MILFYPLTHTQRHENLPNTISSHVNTIHFEHREKATFYWLFPHGLVNSIRPKKYFALMLCGSTCCIFSVQVLRHKRCHELKN